MSLLVFGIWYSKIKLGYDYDINKDKIQAIHGGW